MKGRQAEAIRIYGQLLKMGQVHLPPGRGRLVGLTLAARWVSEMNPNQFVAPYLPG